MDGDKKKHAKSASGDVIGNCRSSKMIDLHIGV